MERTNPASRIGKAVLFSLALVVPALLIGESAFAAGKKQPVPLSFNLWEEDAAPWERYADWPRTNWAAWSSLAHIASPPDPIPKLDGPIKGDAKKGATLAFDRARGGSCVACHVMGKDTPTLPGSVGMDLSTIGTWGRSDEYLFNYVYDARSVNPGSVMPPWGSNKLFNVEEIKDIVAFLKTLKEPHVFKDPLENPATRPVPVETRDNLDPFVNTAMDAHELGKKTFARASARGKSCVGCHTAPEKAFKTWAAGMPYYEKRMKKVLGVEEFIVRHARATTGADYPMQSAENIALSIYLRHLANGQPIKVDVTSPGAKEAAERGKNLMSRKMGQLNFACMDCHTPDKAATSGFAASG